MVDSIQQKNENSEPSLTLGDRNADLPSDLRRDVHTVTPSNKLVTAQLEKLLVKSNDASLRQDVLQYCSSNVLEPYEMEITKVLGITEGSPDFSNIKPEDITSKKLFAFVLKQDPPLFSVTDLIRISLDQKYKTYRSAVLLQLRLSKGLPGDAFNRIVSETVANVCNDLEEKVFLKWLTEFIIPLGVEIQPEIGALILSRVYSRTEAGKKPSISLRKIMAATIEILTQDQNLKYLDATISAAGELGPASYARMLHETREMPFEVGTSRYKFLISLVRPRERKTITVLSQVGFLKDFDNSGIGILAENLEVKNAIDSNETTLSALKHECLRRLKTSDFADVHYWLLRWPMVRDWLSEESIFARLSSPGDWLFNLSSLKAREEGIRETKDLFETQIKVLRTEAEELTQEFEKRDRQGKAAQEEIHRLKEQLRQNAVDSREAKSGQIRQSQVDLLKVMIEGINLIEINSELPDSVRGSLNALRQNLSNFGVSFRYEAGQTVPFNPRDHLASGIEEGSLVKVLTPCYYLSSSESAIALIKARVMPQ